MTAKDHDIPAAFLAECFDANFETGVLTWKRRPREHFKATHAWTTWNKRYAGKRAGSPTVTGYLNVWLTFAGRKRLAKAHRIVFTLAHGRWPAANLRRIDGIEATRSEIQRNRKINRNNSSGYLGVSRHNQSGKWQAKIKVAGRQYYLGIFATAEDASVAVSKAKGRPR